MIEVCDLRKSFGRTNAVAGVSFSVRAGETFGLLGPNGAGKSTTIAMLIGALAPDSGTIRLVDRGAPSEPAIRQLIGDAPQTLSLYEELTALENLKFFGRMYGLASAKLAERVDWALEFAGLIERAKDRVKTFSGGMKRRLNLAVALVHEPQVIFLDEPTAGVDPQSRTH
ncbi:MAG TPA: ABC transporter ATP-binding protein, partial [Lacipirellulaceae bacterium]|nr:ABC transporter ATP-binding protein [Lacipirellulaceae bacterium]